MKKLELLAPAKDLYTGIMAIDHGADAVYIGADRFGARQAAGNSISDIHKLCGYAHLFGAKVHVTVNTIIYDDEIDDTMHMVEQLVDAGVDALLIQDMGLLARVRQMLSDSGCRKVELHASTQCDTRTKEKTAWLAAKGFDRVVLARELSVDEVREIHEFCPEVDLEVFVHGALCVSYSGVCYASQYCFRRSANRGECAQFCRLAFDLTDDKGNVIREQQHMLSLKDLCLIDQLEQLADAGASAFKIEGRLKDAAYVKNVVAAYSEKLNSICRRRPDEYCRSSKGHIDYQFTPDLRKTFNRGYTTYFSNGRQPDIANFDTPKATGEYVGRVKEIRHNSFTVAGTAAFANGDGLCFFNDRHELEGFRVNRAAGNLLYPQVMPGNIRKGTRLYRNRDEAFDKLLSGQTARRRISVDMTLSAVTDGFSLDIITETGKHGQATAAFSHQTAKHPQQENIERQLSKLGNTAFVCRHIEFADGVENMFIPNSILTDLRREAVDKVVMTDNDSVAEQHSNTVRTPFEAQFPWQPEYAEFPYLYNISNHEANVFYEHEGLKNISVCFENGKNYKKPLVMQCRHCIRFSLGFCVRRGGKQPAWKEPLHLAMSDGRRFTLEFKCSECQMNIYAEK